jgi:zona occludens toxin
MIELITGQPGAGKTTFAVAERLVKESKRTITAEDGSQLTRRLVCAGFRGLVLEHEKLPHKLTGEVTKAAEVAKWNELDPKHEDAPVHERLPGEPPLDVPALVENWWLWAQPGDLIAVDEFQFCAPRSTMGRKPPVWIQKLEVHRHYGVDWLIVTQQPTLIDTTIRALVGLHRHVRPVLGSPLCMVYVWDHASNPERYVNAQKSKFIRRAAHFKLFHSSVAHIKPPTQGRLPLLLFLAFVAYFVYAGWKFKEERLTPAKAAPVAQVVARSAVKGSAWPALPNRPAGYVDVPPLAGCYTVGESCTCLGRDGRNVRVDLAMCRASASSFDGLVAWEPRKPPPDPRQAAYGAAGPSSGASAPLSLAGLR